MGAISIVSRKTAFTDLAALMRTVHRAPLFFAQGPLHLLWAVGGEVHDRIEASAGEGAVEAVRPAVCPQSLDA